MTNYVSRYLKLSTKLFSNAAWFSILIAVVFSIFIIFEESGIFVSLESKDLNIEIEALVTSALIILLYAAIVEHAVFFSHDYPIQNIQCIPLLVSFSVFLFSILVFALSMVLFINMSGILKHSELYLFIFNLIDS